MELLKKIVHRLAFRVIDHGCPSVFERLGGPLLVRGRRCRFANGCNRGRSESIERRDKVKHGLVRLRGSLRLGLSRRHRTLDDLCCSVRVDEFGLIIRTRVLMLR